MLSADFFIYSESDAPCCHVSKIPYQHLYLIPITENFQQISNLLLGSNTLGKSVNLFSNLLCINKLINVWNS